MLWEGLPKPLIDLVRHPAMLISSKKRKWVVERIGERVCEDLINLERADAALFIIDVCTALNALPV